MQIKHPLPLCGLQATVPRIELYVVTTDVLIVGLPVSAIGRRAKLNSTSGLDRTGRWNLVSCEAGGRWR